MTTCPWCGASYDPYAAMGHWCSQRQGNPYYLIGSGFVGDEKQLGREIHRRIQESRRAENWGKARVLYKGEWLDKTWHPDGCRCMGGRCRMFVSDR